MATVWLLFSFKTLLIFQAEGSEIHVPPLGYYPLTSASGANDSSSFQNPSGTISHGSPTYGVYGETEGSYSLSGDRISPSYIYLPKSSALDTRFSISLLIWVFPEGRSGEIISYWENSVYGVSISLENTRPVFHVYSRDLVTKYSLQCPIRLSLHDQWYHIGGLYDNNTGVVRLLVNGLVVANDTIGSLELQTTYPLWLGFLLKGRFAQFWIFNVSLSIPEVNYYKDFNKPPTSLSVSSAVGMFPTSQIKMTSASEAQPANTLLIPLTSHPVIQSENTTQVQLFFNHSTQPVSMAMTQTMPLGMTVIQPADSLALRNLSTENIYPSQTKPTIPARTVNPDPLQCYLCEGTPDKCISLEKSKSNLLCPNKDDVCVWQYLKYNETTELIRFNCTSVANCEEGRKACEFIMKEYIGEVCCNLTCCGSDFCNEPVEKGNYCTRKPDLVAIISDSAEIVRGLNKNITLNASLSRDPDVRAHEYKGMNFTWSIVVFGNYTSNQSTPNVSFGPEADIWNSSSTYYGRIVTLNTSSFVVNKTYLVRLLVSKDYRYSTAIQVIHIVPGNPPEITQRCQINCRRKISPSIKLSIDTQCAGRCNITSYEWLLYEAKQRDQNTVWKRRNDLYFLTKTPLDSSNIVIKEKKLDGGKLYRLAVVAKTTDGLPGMTAEDIVTALPPYGGNCTVTPSTGKSLTTNFNLSCSNWTSDSHPLTYQFQYQLRNGLYSMIYYGTNSSVTSWLPPGNITNNFLLDFVIVITDSYGASAPDLHLSVQVTPSALLSPENITNFVTSNDSLLNQIFHEGDMNKAARLANIVLDVLAGDSQMDPVQKLKIRDFIIGEIVQHPTKNIPELLQSSSVIGSATQEPNAASVTSMLSSLFAIDQMTSLLNATVHRKELSVLPLITQSAENLGYCLHNLLKAGSFIAKGDFGSDFETQGRNMVEQSVELVSTVGELVLALWLPDEGVVTIQARDLHMTLQRLSPTKLAGLNIEGGEGRFALPTEKEVLEPLTKDTSFVDVQMLSMPFTPFTWDETRERVNSDVLSLELKDNAHRLIEASNLSSGLFIAIPLKPVDESAEKHQFFTKSGNLRFHEIHVEYENTLIQLELNPADKNVDLIFYLRYNQRPTSVIYELNGTVTRKETCVWRIAHDGKVRAMCTSSGSPAPIRTLAIKPGNYYLAVKISSSTVAPSTRVRRSCFGQVRHKRSCVEVKDPPPTPPRSKNETISPKYDASTDKNYTLRVIQGSCVYWSDKRNMWATDGCEVLSATLNGFMNCSCNHLTSFGGGLLVAPNPIDFDQVLIEFKKIPETGNVAVIITVAVVVLAYCSVLVIARRMDKEDYRKNCLPVELSTQSANLYEYEITISTGVWRNSGSTARIAMEIYGSEGSSGILQLNAEAYDHQLLFSRGNTDVFTVKVSKCLGVLHGVRIGHDNSGQSPSWFLEDVVVMDRPGNRSWTFVSNRWLALERGDGRIERVLDSSLNQTDFNYDVMRRWWKGLTEKHIWLSVVAKPSRNRFTRVQRASCCLSVMLSAMLANAMFYRIEGKSEQTIQVGPLKFSWRQVVVGIESALIVAPVNLLIAFLFQKVAEKTSDQTPACSKGRWLGYAAWMLCFCTCAVSAAFSIFYSLAWGRSLSEQWLASMFISFAQDTAVTEPLKVFFMALFVAAILRSQKNKGKDYTPNGEDKDIASQGKLWSLKLSEVEEMRKSQAKKENISRFFVELFLYLVFIFLLMMVLYGDRNDYRYTMTRSVEDGLPGFERVSSTSKLWDWLNRMFLPGVFVGAWYNGEPENQSVYIGNKHSILVGMPRARQIRIKPSPCEVLDYMKPYFPECYDFYSNGNEDTTPFSKPGWMSTENATNTEELFRLCPKPWRYQAPAETDSVPKWGKFALYPGGGFVSDFGYENSTGFGIAQTLANQRWLDRQSRAVLVEFSAFNPAVNLLAIGTYFYEIQPMGFGQPFQRIEVISLYSKETRSHQFYLICILLFIVFVLVYFGIECYKVVRQKTRYFKSIWNWLEIFQALVSFLAVIVYVVRSQKTSLTVLKLQENVYANVSFQEAITWAEAENAVLGVLTFLATLKLLRLIRFNDHVAVFSRTLRISSRLLVSFSLILSIGFMAFLHFGILLFGNGTERYSSFLKGVYFQLELILGRVKARPINDLAEANQTFGRIFAGFLLASLTIMGMNFLIATVNESLSMARNTVIHSDLYRLVDEDDHPNTKRGKIFFDAISQAVKKARAKQMSSSTSLYGGDKQSSNTGNTTNFDFDSISKGIQAARKQKKRRKSYFDKISDVFFRMKRRSKGYKPMKKPKHLRKNQIVLFTKAVNESRFTELEAKKSELFHALDSIVSGFSDEEETFYFLCQQILETSNE